MVLRGLDDLEITAGGGDVEAAVEAAAEVVGAELVLGAAFFFRGPVAVVRVGQLGLDLHEVGEAIRRGVRRRVLGSFSSTAFLLCTPASQKRLLASRSTLGAFGASSSSSEASL